MMIASQGLSRLTVDAVARAAGVTKGGLFHHFATKQDLIDGVLDMMTQYAEEAIAGDMASDDTAQGRFTRAYLNGVFGDHRLTDTTSASSVCLAMTDDPTLQCRWTDWVAQQVARHAETDDNDSCAVVRLAADGIWLSSIRNPDAPPVPESVRRKLVAMTYDSA